MSGYFSKFKLDRSIGKAEKIDNTVSEWMAPKPCDRCRKRRIRCDRALNNCNQCEVSGFKCTYLYVPKKRGPKAKNNKDIGKYMILLHKLSNSKDGTKLHITKEQSYTNNSSIRSSNQLSEAKSDISHIRIPNKQPLLIPLSDYCPQFSKLLLNKFETMIPFPYYFCQNHQFLANQDQFDTHFQPKNYFNLNSQNTTERKPLTSKPYLDFPNV